MAKLKEVQKKQSTGFKVKCVAAAFIVASLCTTGLVALCKAENINLISVGYYSADEIIQAMNIEYGENLAFMDIDEIEEKLEGGFPYIEDAIISKTLPSTINVEVIDAVPVASIVYKGAYVYVSDSGKILEINAKPASGAVIANFGEIEDKDGYISLVNSEQNDSLTVLLTSIEECEIENVTGIDISDVHNISITSNEKIVIELGNATELDFKLKFAKQVIESGNIPETDSGTLDLSLGRETNQAYYKSNNLSN